MAGGSGTGGSGGMSSGLPLWAVAAGGFLAGALGGFALDMLRPRPTSPSGYVAPTPSPDAHAVLSGPAVGPGPAEYVDPED